MKIAVMGAGAVGGYYGGVLARSGADVTLIARGANADAMRARGLSVSSHWGDFVVKPDVAEMPADVGEVDLVLHCVKLYSNSDAIPTMSPLVGNDTVLLTLQNGITGGEALADEFGWDQVLEGATYIESSLFAPGKVVQSGSMARIEFGSRSGASSLVIDRVSSALDVSGIQVVVSDDIRSVLWSKMVAIGALGTVVTVARASLGEVLEFEEGLNTLRTVMEEIVSCGKAHGVSFPTGIADSKLSDAIAEADEFQSSLQLDFNRGGALELDDILGAAVRLGRDSGIPMPASATLVMSLQKFKHGK